MEIEDPFKAFKLILKTIGLNLDKSSSEKEERFYKRIYYLQLSLGASFLITIVWNIWNYQNSDFVEISYCFTTLTAEANTGGMMLLLFGQHFQLEAMLDKMERLISIYSKEKEYRLIIEKAIEKSEKITFFFAKSFMVTMLSVWGAAYVNYFFMSNAKLPLPMKMLFYSENHFHLGCLTQMMMVFPSVILIFIIVSIYCYFTIVVSALFSVLHLDLRKIGRKRNVIKKSIDCYKILIQIVNHCNNIVQYLLIWQHQVAPAMITFCLYNFVKLQRASDSRALTFLGFSYYCILSPLLYCVSGTVISSKNEETVNALYDNDWYNLELSDRKSLIVFTAMANQKLTLNFRRMVYFDMAEYQWIIKTAYSFLAVVQMLDTSNNK